MVFVTDPSAQKGGDSQVQDEAQQLIFLQAIHPVCLAAQQRGQNTLELQCGKAAVVERIVELIEELPDNSPPGAILANSLIAVGNLRICIGSCQTSWMLCWGTCWQSPQTPTGSTTSWSTLTTGLYPGCHGREPGPLGAARPCSDPPSPSLSLITQQNSPGWVTMWHSWLCSLVTQPKTSAGRPGNRLYQLLLHQRGLTIHEAKDLCCWDWLQDSRLLGYRNIARVGEQEDVTANMMHQLHIIRHLSQLPEALQGLCL
ncbi:uncharacterized protein LOC115649051 [Gopherus evgoodei]|uniref:uncharacterized protein LOC115649051 n=1 Tax=Gopherus evgoodei TaxID=1825980 RepID=UPI0011CF9F4C|nr:uncharacterized protein LOC115649051 [Gopherus evgoodei]